MSAVDLRLPDIPAWSPLAFTRASFRVDRCSQDVIETAARVLDVSFGELIGEARDWHVAHRRWLVMLWLRETWGYSLPRIGKLLRRDHTTTLHGIRKARQKLETDPDYRALYATLKEALA